MEILEELHRPRRVDFGVADPNGLAYQSHELAEVRLLEPANAYVVGVIHSPLVPAYVSAYMPSISSRYLRLTRLRFSFIVGVSSSSSAVRICSISRNSLIVSTRANRLFTVSISVLINAWIGFARHSEA